MSETPRRKPLYSQRVLEFTKREISICIAEDLAEAARHAEKKTGRNLAMTDRDKAAKGLCLSYSNGACYLLFAYNDITGNRICHEVTHATNAMFAAVGLKLGRKSDEAFAYHNDMLFRMIAELLDKAGIIIPLTQ